ncbi:MAG TPA: DNA polymerase III subunit alpha [Chitinophagaceae bacterium]|nr:DNA polymerase III subunit alpha [Chitinophagaceae bacterium]
MPRFSHLHVHTQFSLLDGAADIRKLYRKAIEDHMPALAITDHGNMFGVFKFVAEASLYKLNPDDPMDKRPLVKPVVGCEFYLAEDRLRRQFTREDRDIRYHQVLLARNETGYRNLIKLSSLGYMEGMYGKYPRIDKDLIRNYSGGLIATTCCLGASVPKILLKKGEEAAEEEFRWWLDIFGEDYYVELQRHGIPEQDTVNRFLLRMSGKYRVKMFASNDSHYVDQADYKAHDILLCINTGEMQSTPAIREFADDDILVKNKRFAFYNDQYFFKTTEEMSLLFADLPEAIETTVEIVDKIDYLDLKRDILLPNFPLPPGFQSQDEYLRHLTWSGLSDRYTEITPGIEERVRFELETISKMGFAGYFLIVADFIRAGRALGVYVGPGRGSAAGSVVAYSTGITNIDPLRYNLLFERFLNPDRNSLPDIDTDFDDEGRQKVIDYVVEKYGKHQVAQIVTYGTMAARMSIKDVGRVLNLSPDETGALSKLVPERPGIELNRLLHAPLSGVKSLNVVEKLGGQDLENVNKLRLISQGTDIRAEVLREAAILEGSVRNTGIHAAGIIIAPRDLTELIPVCTAKDSTLLVTQYEGGIIESAGVIKMDFLGLKTLSIIKNSLESIEKNHGVSINIDRIPLDDTATYGLYQLGATNATFQFESPGMQKYLRDLKPDKFEDLIAMNALYRPGPMDYIPKFIRRKNGLEPVTFELPGMEDVLRETYGITVYQEQVMLLSQQLAGFSRGEADILRKAMGKKQKAVLDKMKSQFMEGCSSRGFPIPTCEKIWGDWESFAQYAFNKSHATCYALVAYQTAWLKTHYPAEYMSAVLNYASGIDKVTFFMEECHRMGIPVLGPDLNESGKGFAVNTQGEIRFGLAGIKGVGAAAMEDLLGEREKNGPFSTVFDLVKRVNQRAINKKSLEALVCSGALDCFKEIHRAQYFYKGENEAHTGLEKIIRFGNLCQQGAKGSSGTLFGESETTQIIYPVLSSCEPWPLVEKLSREKEVTGMYLSGHPLDHYQFEWENYQFQPIRQINESRRMASENPGGVHIGQPIRFAGFLSMAERLKSKKGNWYGKMLIEDYTASMEILLLGEDYIRFGNYLEQGYCLFLTGSFRTRPYRDDEIEFRISNIQLLEDVKKKQTRQITLTAYAEAISPILIEYLALQIRTHPGKAELYVELKDPAGGLNIRLRSFQHQVELSDELVAFLGNQEGITVKIGI